MPLALQEKPETCHNPFFLKDDQIFARIMLATSKNLLTCTVKMLLTQFPSPPRSAPQ